MRIIAGEFRGRPLTAPKGDGTRPTTDRVRESLMSALSSARGGFDGAVVLDAFAGSGALGLEALSRGAASVCLCENDRAALQAVGANCAKLGVEVRGLPGGRQRGRRFGVPAADFDGPTGPPRVHVRAGDVMKRPPVSSRPAFDLVFLDPPYAYAAGDVLAMVERLDQAGALADDAVVSYEHDRAVDFSADAAVVEALHRLQLTIVSHKEYGGTALDILKRSVADC